VLVGLLVVHQKDDHEDDDDSNRDDDAEDDGQRLGAIGGVAGHRKGRVVGYHTPGRVVCQGTVEIATTEEEQLLKVLGAMVKLGGDRAGQIVDLHIAEKGANCKPNAGSQHKRGKKKSHRIMSDVRVPNSVGMDPERVLLFRALQGKEPNVINRKAEKKKSLNGAYISER